jgi:hypothetical protein
MRMIEFRVPSVHPGQTTDEAVFVDPKHVIHATSTQEDPPAMKLTLSTGKEVDVAGTVKEVMRALGGSTKLAKVKDPEPTDGALLDGVKSEEDLARDAKIEEHARGDYEPGRPADNGEGRERRVPTGDGYKPEAAEEKPTKEREGVKVRR